MIEEEEWSKEQEANRKPGQKHPTPSPGFADRVFYESLLQQRPESKMARKWCLEYGVLKWAEAEALCKELGVPINVSRPGKSPTSAKSARAGKSSSNSSSRQAERREALAADELGLGSGSGFEGIGLSTLYFQTYANALSQQHGAHSYVGRGLYALQLALWLRVFPREQVLVIDLDDMRDAAGTQREANRAFEFLDLPPHAVADTARKNTRAYEPMASDMTEKLRAFYAPYNEQLFELLGRRFQW